jgi:hypothetical protein
MLGLFLGQRQHRSDTGIVGPGDETPGCLGDCVAWHHALLSGKHVRRSAGDGACVDGVTDPGN